MNILAMTIRLYAPWVHSLKEKRMEVKSLVARLQNTFHVSAAEVDAQDVHQTLVLGVAAIAPTTALGDSMADHILSFVASSTQAEIVAVTREFR